MQTLRENIEAFMESYILCRLNLIIKIAGLTFCIFGTSLFYSLDISFFIVFQKCIDRES